MDQDAVDAIKIPGYSIIRPLGEGGMAVVYLAIQDNFEREVAIKVMAESIAAQENFSERFLQEAKIVSRLVHPNIVTVYDMGIANGLHYLSMEYVPGTELKSMFRTLGAADAVRIVKDIARALDYAGRKGYVHRDVKPENIMLHEEDGRAVLMDFGIARAADGVSGMTQTGMALGTPHYMSPEQARGRDVDPRSDLYSLGVVFYLMLTGDVPFEADTPVAVGLKHITEPVPALPEGLSVFQPIINGLLAKDPNDRYQSGAELIAALEEIPSGEVARADYYLRKGPGTPPATRRATPTGRTAGRDATPSRGQPALRATPRPRPAVRSPSGPTTATAPRRSRRRSLWAILSLLLVVGAYYALFGTRIPPDPQQLAAVKAQLGITGTVPAPANLPAPADGETDAQTAAPASSAPPATADVSAEGAVDAAPEQPAATTADAGAPPVPEAPADSATPATEPAASPQQALLARAEELAATLPEDPDLAPELAAVYREILQLTPDHPAASAGLNRLHESALAAVNQALAADDLAAAASALDSLAADYPRLANSEAVAELRGRLERRQRIASLLAEGRQLLEEDRLSTPAGDSAADRFRAVLELKPGEPQALAGMDAIAQRYRQLAAAQREQGELDRALQLVQSGLDLRPQHAGLNELLDNLQRDRDTRQRIASLIDWAEELELKGQWFGPGEDNAAAKYMAILELAPGHPAATAGLARLREGIAQQVREAIDARDFRQAAAVLEPALAQFPDNSELLTVRQNLAAARPAVEQLVASGQPIAELPAEQPTAVDAERTLYLTFRYRNFSQPTTVLQAILYDGTRNVRIAAVPVIVNGQNGLKQFRIERPVDGFSAGGYHVDLLAGDDTVASVSFVIN